MGTITFRLNTRKKHDPFANDPPFASDFHNALGRFFIVWSKLERAVDIIAYSARSIESMEPFAGSARSGITSKLKLLRKALRSHPPHARSQKWIADLLIKIENAACERNILVHGVYDGFTADPVPRIRFKSSTYDPLSVKRKHLEITLAQLNALIRKMDALDRQLMPLVLSTVTAPRTGGKS